ncbi:MAG TPA: SRPBCC family protein [Fimbriimonadaceae bacterium]|nr:SRPBCC family protein [Fimbriimonadaceae bacterium]
MAASDYRFVTLWEFDATIEEISEILEDVESLPVWWPSVYLGVAVDEPGDAKGVGKVVRLLTRGWLPYTLRWTFRVTASDCPNGFALDAGGDFVGEGVWSLRQEGARALVLYDWSVRAKKPLLRWLSFAIKPIFSANHRWAMAQGEKSLALELRRRRAKRERRLERVPLPPGPAMYSGPLLGAAAALVVLGVLAAMAKRRQSENT